MCERLIKSILNLFVDMQFLHLKLFAIEHVSHIGLPHVIQYTAQSLCSGFPHDAHVVHLPFIGVIQFIQFIISPLHYGI